jgi:predicted component of type VI protein secretion system
MKTITVEQRDFVEAMAEAEKCIQRTQAALQRAKSKCHADVYEHLDVISKRAYELRVRSEWLRLAVLGVIEPTAVDPHVRQNVDRRSAIDRRVEGMRRQVLAAT